MVSMAWKTYLGLRWRVFIVAVGSSTERSTGTVLTGADATTLGQVLLALRLADLDLLLFTAATQLFWFERVLGLELGAPMLGNVSVSHCCSRRACAVFWRLEWRGDGGRG